MTAPQPAHADRTPGRVLDLVLRVADHQVVGPEGLLLGNVDNLVLREHDGRLLVTGFVSGPGGLGPRLPGRLGRWVQAVWRRLRSDPDAHPTMVPFSAVVRIGSAVEVTRHGQQVLATTMGLEHWLRTYVVSRIPGAQGGEDRLEGEPVQDAAQHVWSPGPGSHLLSDLLGARVRSPQGDDLGAVLDVCAEPVAPTEAAVGVLRVRGLSYGARATGSELGYTEDPRQGPLLLRLLFRRLHRAHRYVPLDAVDVDWQARVVTVAPGARPVHPHER